EPLAPHIRSLWSQPRLICGEHRPRRDLSSRPAVYMLKYVVIAFALLLWTAASYGADRVPRLIDAVKAGDREAVRSLLKQPLAVKDAERDGTTALHYAVRADDVETMRMLLRAGADVNAPTREGITPLALAAVNGSLVSTQ